MQIVIELDEEEYNDFVNRGKDIPLPHLFGAVYHAIELPKEHGRLIDADELVKYLRSNELDSDKSIEKLIKKAPTIAHKSKGSEW